MVEESTINDVIQGFESKDNYVNTLEKLVSQAPAIVSYLETEGFSVLTEEENELMWYCTAVIYESWTIKHRDISFSAETLMEVEEAIYSQVDGLSFTAIADTFFHNYPEEDLLAFVEDTLVPDEESYLTPVGRTVMFVSLKAIIDTLSSGAKV